MWPPGVGRPARTVTGNATLRPLAAVRSGGRRAATTLIDQSFSSVSNFAVGVAVARVAGASGLGGFSLGLRRLASGRRRCTALSSLIRWRSRVTCTTPAVTSRTRGVRRGIKGDSRPRCCSGLVGACDLCPRRGALMLFGQRTFGHRDGGYGPVAPVVVGAGLLAVDRLHDPATGVRPRQRHGVQLRARSGLCRCVRRSIRIPSWR